MSPKQALYLEPAFKQGKFRAIPSGHSLIAWKTLIPRQDNDPKHTAKQTMTYSSKEAAGALRTLENR